jgi:hypothetical protein
MGHEGNRLINEGVAERWRYVIAMAGSPDLEK